jgi:hypothetical protein
MQSISVYLYPNRIDAYTNSLAAWQTERYRRVYNRNIKIFRGLDNRIDIQVRNSDQKSQDITGSNVVFILVSRESQEQILKKDCIVQSATSGKVYVVLTEAELNNIDAGFYQYSIYTETREEIEGTDEYYVTARSPMFVDSQYGSIATIEVENNVKGEPLDSVEVTIFALHDPATKGLSEPAYYLSSLIDARPKLLDNQSNHTFQFNMSNYTGQIIIQASISNGSNPNVWSDLETLNFGTEESISYSNQVGKWNWFRIKSIPTNGSLDKVLYR